MNTNDKFINFLLEHGEIKMVDILRERAINVAASANMFETLKKWLTSKGAQKIENKNANI